MNPPDITPDRLTALLAEETWARRLARALVGEHDGDDLVQTVLTKAVRRGDPARRVPARATWSRALRNEAANLARSRSRRADRERSATRSESDSVPDPAEVFERTEERRRLAGLLLELPDDLRYALVLHYEEGLDSEEIGRRLGVTGSTVRTRLARGREVLREKLEREDPDWRTGLLLLAGLEPAAVGGLWISFPLLFLMKPLLAIASAAALWFFFARVLAPSLPMEPAPAAGPVVTDSLEGRPVDVGGGLANVSESEANESTRAPLATDSLEPPAFEVPSVDTVTVRLRLVDGAHAPLPGATVSAELGEVHTRVADGEGRVEWVFNRPQVPSHRNVRFLGEAPGQLWGWRAEVLDQREERDLGELVLRPTALVNGRLVDPAGEPVANVDLSTQGEYPADPFGPPQRFFGATSDAYGNFTLRLLSEARSMVAVQDDAWTSEQVEFEALLGKTLDLGDLLAQRYESEVDPVVRCVDERGRTVRPEIFQIQELGDGHGPARLHSPAKRIPVRFDVDANSTREVEIFAYHSELGSASWRGPRNTFGNDRVLELQPDRPTEVTVVDPAGRRVELGELRLLLPGSRTKPARTWTGSDAGGPFVVRLPRGPFRFEGESSTGRALEPAELAGWPGPSLQLVEMPVVARVAGRVTRGSAPAAGHVVLLFPARSESGQAYAADLPTRTLCKPIAQGRTDSEGRFTIDSSSTPGFLVVRDERGNETWVDWKELGVTEEVAVELEDFGSIEGRVKSESALPEFMVAFQGGRDGRSTPVGFDGSFRFEGLTPGAWFVVPLDLEREPQQGRTWFSPEDDPFDFGRANAVVRSGEVTQLNLEHGQDRSKSMTLRLTVDRSPAAGWIAELEPLDYLGRFDSARTESIVLDGFGEGRLELPGTGLRRLRLESSKHALRMTWTTDLAALDPDSVLELDLETAEVELRLGQLRPFVELRVEDIGPGFQSSITLDARSHANPLRVTIPVGRLDVRAQLFEQPDLELGPYFVEAGESLSVSLP